MRAAGSACAHDLGLARAHTLVNSVAEVRGEAEPLRKGAELEGRIGLAREEGMSICLRRKLRRRLLFLRLGIRVDMYSRSWEMTE